MTLLLWLAGGGVFFVVTLALAILLCKGIKIADEERCHGCPECEPCGCLDGRVPCSYHGAEW